MLAFPNDQILTVFFTGHNAIGIGVIIKPIPEVTDASDRFHCIQYGCVF
ncbi:hypothetical protein H206_05577 [Candidatus Electrothrix aarhusensis]|uniref:Uncharacterized protein n=1 Tax=Candidatus Electrothrix aarhusensis TaxID=1859131 RepID=A0A444J428_9BACT|nr:hypothetical protein H206_05577 [Candidatus Electrothrix aarhusensis]